MAKTCLVITGCLLLCATAFADEKDPRTNLDSAFDNCIRVLEKKDYETLITQCLYPPRVKDTLKEITKEEFIELCRNGGGDLLLKMLKAVKGTKPTFSDSFGEKRATFKFDKPIGELDEINFIQRNGKWYLIDG